MGRGAKANEGDTRTSANGYHYTRTVDRWRLTHHLIAEQQLGRPLREDEGVYFDDGKRENLSPENIKVRDKGRGSLRRRRSVIEDRIRELQAELEEINKELQER